MHKLYPFLLYNMETGQAAETGHPPCLSLIIIIPAHSTSVKPVMIPGLLAIQRLKVNGFCDPLPKFSQGAVVLLGPAICPPVYLILFTYLVLLCSSFIKCTHRRIFPVPHKVGMQDIIFIVIDTLAVPQSVHQHDILLCLQVVILFR